MMGDFASRPPLGHAKTGGIRPGMVILLRTRLHMRSVAPPHRDGAGQGVT